VVGVVPDLVYEELGEETPQSQLTIYVPYVQLGWRTMAIVVRAPSGPGALAAPVRRAIREVDPVFAAFDVLTMEDRRAATQWGERFLGRTFAMFAVAALLLVCVGAYGLTAYSAVQRTKEIGLRLAVGATRPDIVRLLLGGGVRLAAIGLAMGAPLAVGGARLLEGLLFRVSAWDPVFWLAVPAALLGPILLANYLPARRASLADPAEALRQE
jgi:putative ABC transport system permease protein